MPKKSYPLEVGSSVKVELQWKGIWKDFTVSVDGRELGRMNGEDELVQGGAWKLDDGTLLQVMLDKSAMGGGLQVTRGGVPLPGSSTDPKAQLNGAAGVTFFIGGLNILLGVAAALLEVPMLVELGLGWGSLVFGLIFVGLGFAIRKGSLVALIVAIGLFAVDGVLGIYWALEADMQPGVGGIVVRVALLMTMIKAVGAAKRKPSA